MTFFMRGLRAILPITAGVIPFGLVMGSIFSEANIPLLSAMVMNIFVFAGASQLAAVELMTQKASLYVVIATGVVINLRMLLYSAALAPVLKHSRTLTKMFGAYCITDQTYSVMMAESDRIAANADKIKFYFGASVGMISAWQVAVILGYVFGNFAPAAWSLDYAVPLSFVALLMPTLKNKIYILIAFISAGFSLLLKDIPYNLGLLLSALIAMACAISIMKLNKQEQK